MSLQRPWSRTPRRWREATSRKRDGQQMSEVRIEDRIAIDASASKVWEALKDPAAHARWHPFVNTDRSRASSRSREDVLGDHGPQAW